MTPGEAIRRRSAQVARAAWPAWATSSLFGPTIPDVDPPCGPRKPRLVAHTDAVFPASLRTGCADVSSIWSWGDLPAAGQDAVAIVGSRAASARGRSIATALAADLGQAGLSVVSGGAYGIDAAAHEGALSAGTPTFAVFGCGIDVVYPDRHASLFERIRMTRGSGLLSEYGPGVAPRRGQFPARNRIIVALARAVIVVEAKPRSGALVTARLSRTCGTLLLAVAGSHGTDGLIASGDAACVRDAADVLTVLGGGTPQRPEVPQPVGLCAALVAAVRAGHAEISQLMNALARPLPEVLAALSEAELEGWLVRGPGNRYEVSRGN